MSLAIFDLDNTLIAGDSDFLWGQFLVDRGIVDKNYYEHANRQFYADYQQGNLDIEKYLAFSLAPLALHDIRQLLDWREEFMAEIIQPLYLAAGQALVETHRRQGDTLLVITATNRFVTEPIAKLYGIDILLATTPEMAGGQYTGKFTGVPCYREGKVTHLDNWLAANAENLDNSWFYSDSHNDLPLLNRVANPVVVDPDPELLAAANQAGWPVISLRV